MSGLERSTSAVFDAADAMVEAITEAGPPGSPNLRGPVVVDMGDREPHEGGREGIYVIGRVDDNDIEWGGSVYRDERFVIGVVIRVSAPWAKSGRDCMGRLRELADFVQQVFHPAEGGYTPPQFTGVQRLGGVSGVTFTVVGAKEGFLGVAQINVSLHSKL